MKRLAIIGASGHGRVLADIAKITGYTDIVFLDDNPDKSECAGYPIIGPSYMASDLDAFLIVGIGNTVIRRRIQESLPNEKLITLIHPDAVIAEDVIIGEGSVVMAGVVLNTGTKVGKGCIINTSSSVDHDCEIGDYVHIAVGSHVCGGVQVDCGSWVGAGAVISNNLYICPDCIIGAGTVLIDSIYESGTYVGVPARKINRGVKPNET